MTMTFTPKPDMLATELTHRSMIEVPMSIAVELASQMGTPQFRSNGYAAWYADLCWSESAETNNPITGNTIPMSLTIDRDDKCAVSCPWERKPLMEAIIRSMVPFDFMERLSPLPTQVQRAPR